MHSSKNCVTKILATHETRVPEEAGDSYRIPIEFPFQAENLRDKNPKESRVKKKLNSE